MRWFICIASLLLFASSADAQFKTGKKYVTAIVDPNNQGLITIRQYPGTLTSPILSYPQKSFISVKIGDKIFTNNHTGGHITDDPRFGGFLDNGSTQKIADTIRTTWANMNGCSIIQEVYPVLLDMSEQIVMRWKVKNNNPPNTSLKCQNQLLIDLQVGAQNPNDGAPILTRYGYRPIWEKYTPDNGAYGVPWFFASFEHQLPNAPEFTPGITGAGYNQDVNYKLGLKRPSLMAVGDWGSPMGTAALVDFLWGISASAPWGSTYSDAAILFQWDESTVAGGQTVELSRTSYGTPEFGICRGQLFGVVFYPRRFEWKDPVYEPEIGNIEFYAFDVYSPLPQDPNFGPPSTDTYLKLHVGPNLRIVSPDTARSANQKIQRQQTDPNGFIPQYGVGSAIWKVVADKVNNCKDDLNSWLKFTAESSLSGTGPIFFNSGDADTCEHLVVIDCTVVDTLPPIVENIDTTPRYGKYTRTFDVRDNRSVDKGLDQIKWVATPGSNTDLSKFSASMFVTPPPCSKDTHTVWFVQGDSTVAGCFDFTFIDCAANDTTITFCFSAHPYVETIDTVPPLIILDSTNKRSLIIKFSDKTVNDWGVDSIWVTPNPGTNSTKFSMGIAPGLDSCSKLQHTYTITQLDTNFSGCFSVAGIDCAGNSTAVYSYCFPLPTSDVPIGDQAHETIELLGNPASDRSILRINLTKSQNAIIRVVNIAGREVVVQNVQLSVGVNDIPIVTADFAEGAYYVIAEWDGRQFARKLQIIK